MKKEILREGKKELYRRKERTLRAAWLISLWAPLGTGVAMVLGRSTVLFADFLRRSSELLALFLAWLVIRKVSQGKNARFNYGYGKLENLSSLIVATVMVFSFVIIAFSAAGRILDPRPLAILWPGILVASGGLIVNSWFWRRTSALNREESTPVFEAHWRLYRAKSIIDLAVLITLGMSALLRDYNWSVYIDPAGSLIIAVFLLGSAYRITRASVLEILDRSLNEKIEPLLKKELSLYSDRYTSLQDIRSRKSGGTLLVEIFLEFRENTTAKEMVMIREEIRKSLEEKYPICQVNIIAV